MGGSEWLWVLESVDQRNRKRAQFSPKLRRGTEQFDSTRACPTRSPEQHDDWGQMAAADMPDSLSAIRRLEDIGRVLPCMFLLHSCNSASCRT